jgi:dihydroorotase
MRRPVALYLLALAVLAAAPSAGVGQQARHDIVIANGRVMDPATGLDAVRHVGISGGTIRAISTRPLAGRTTIDAKGLVVAPGFIDLHQHGMTDENYPLKVADGVTSALELEVGVGDIERFYAERAGKPLINYGASVGHIPVRMAVLGDSGGFLPSGPAAQRAATDAELAEILRRLELGLRQGAVGVGLGIAYTPLASRWEIAEAFRAAGRARAPVFVHMRGGGDVIAAFEEALALSVVSGAPLHVVHVQSTGGRNTPRVLQMIAEARRSGVDVTTEMYPWTASASSIQSALYDNWESYPDSAFGRFLWPPTGERLTRETFAKYRKQGGSVISFGNTEAVVRGAVADSLTMIASDGGLRGGKGHPRGTGTFARVLGRYVRDEQALTLMDALRKMTIMPARRLETVAPMMKRKGRIAVGADADITVFDPATVIDRATYEQPAAPSTGIVHVLVNGVVVLRDGQLRTDAGAPGRPIRGTVAPAARTAAAR